MAKAKESLKVYEPRVSNEQKHKFVDFMEQHPDFAKGKLLGPDGRKTRLSLWEVLATQLNACDGPNKTSDKWQKVWTDLKNKTKRKAGEIKKDRNATGGGPPLPPLNDFEKKLVEILTNEAVYGLEGIDNVELDSENVPHKKQKMDNVDEVNTDDAVLENEHDYAGVSEPVSPGWISDENLTETSTPRSSTTRVSTPHTEKTSKSGKQNPTIADAINIFDDVGSSMNNQMAEISASLTELVHERKQTNILLSEIVEVLKKKSTHVNY